MILVLTALVLTTILKFARVKVTLGSFNVASHKDSYNIRDIVCLEITKQERKAK